MKINSNFIAKWEKRYDLKYVKKYKEILEQVKIDIENLGSISSSAFEELYKWKSNRSVGRLEMQNYENIYFENIKIAQSLAEDKKIYILNGMPGVRIAVASTILHFIYPNEFPIIDENTIKALQYFGRLDKNKSITTLRDKPELYNRYRHIILEINEELGKTFSLRRIDRALFAFGQSLNNL